MPVLIIKYPDSAPYSLKLGKLRITLGRSARNDVCIPDPFASRVHTEVRREGDLYVLQDLGSANGTYYDDRRVEGAVILNHGGRIQIGETEIIYYDSDETYTAAAIEGFVTNSSLSIDDNSLISDRVSTAELPLVNQTNLGSGLYVVGGTMRPHSVSYIERQADRELIRRVVAGDFCYVLTPRQMGKSSLMVHVAQQIKKHNIIPIIVDLTLIGTEQGEDGASQWYYGIAYKIIKELKLRVDLNSWWDQRKYLTATQHLTQLFDEILLPNTNERVVVFVDEIDTTIGMSFTDDFFAAIRAFYNVRASQSEYERLSFVLLGVASPSDLIKDERKTPFNIGHGINLTDFSFEEAKPLAKGLGTNYEESERTLRHILGWTGGHPYLTQKACYLVAEAMSDDSGDVDVDRIVNQYFLSPEATHQESNLSYVRDRLTKDKERLEILKVYERIAQGFIVKDNPLSAIHSALKLSGLVVPNAKRHLEIRNRIYADVFTEDWAQKSYAELHDETSDLPVAIENRRAQSTEHNQKADAMKHRTGSTAKSAAAATDHGDLLALISKVGVTLLASATLDETLRQVALLVFDAVPAERCLIMLRDDEGGELKIRAAEVRDRRSEVGEVRVSQTIVEEVITQGRSIFTSEVQHEPHFRFSPDTFQGIRSVLAVPLGVGGRIFGMIYADSSIIETRFTEDHLKVLTTLGSVAAIRVENTRLLEEHLEQERFERELQLAREIQQRFQPTAPPIVPGYELQGISFPSYQIGGDYYDFILCTDGRLVVALGDVSGKGTSAALLMSSLHAAVHAQVASSRPITETVDAVNRYLADNTPANRFVTLFYAELDPLTGSLSFINAGYNPPTIAHNNGLMEHLATGGLPLGIIPDFDYREIRTQLSPGDVLVAYSDGVTEQTNPRGEEFGRERLLQVIEQNVSLTAIGIRDKIEASLSRFAEGTPADDDITLVIVKRTMEVK